MALTSPRIFTAEAAETEPRSADSSQHARHARASTPQRDGLSGSSLADGKLQLEAKLGAGSMGEVYRATHRDLQMRVAVKVLRPDTRERSGFSQRFQAEARAASNLDHKNLTRVIDFGEEPSGLLYLSMEFLDGRTLEDALADGALSQSHAVGLMMQICAGLWHAHARGVIHRDVKPANVILVPAHDDDGQPYDLVKLCDFGIATDPAMTGNRADISGTPEYMAPEVLMGERADGRADLYACGVLLFELVTGRRPFQGMSVTDLARAHVQTPPPRPSSLVRDVDPALEQIILRALAKSPADRFPSVQALRNALKDLTLAPPSRSDPVLARGKKTTQDALLGAAAFPGREAWIEDAAASYDRVLMAAATGSYHEGEVLATELMKAPKERLEAIAALRSSPAFADTVDCLEKAIVPLAKRGEAELLAGIVQVMAAIYTEATSTMGASATATGPGARALALLQTVASRETLRPLVERALSDPAEPSEYLDTLLSWTKAAGAAALYAVRLDARRIASLAWSRDRFATLMRKLGGSALPVLREALQQMAPMGGGHVQDPPLVCDLLRAIPALPDQALAEVVRAYTRAEMPAVVAAALRALGALGEIDRSLVVRLEALIGGQAPAPLEVRLAAASALSGPTPGARPTATRVALASVSLGSGVLSRILGDGSNDELVVACARTALILSRRDAEDIIKGRAQKSSEPLRARLLSLL